MQSYGPTTALVIVDIQNDFADPAGSLSVRGGEAIVPRVDLWVRRSITDVGGAPVSPSRRGLADIAVAPAAVPPGATDYWFAPAER